RTTPSGRRGAGDGSRLLRGARRAARCRCGRGQEGLPGPGARAPPRRVRGPGRRRSVQRARRGVRSLVEVHVTDALRPVRLPGTVDGDRVPMDGRVVAVRVKAPSDPRAVRYGAAVLLAVALVFLVLLLR